jgi:hypothetical protein
MLFPPKKPRTEARWVNEKALRDRRAASFQRQEKRLNQTRLDGECGINRLGRLILNVICQ